MEYRVSKKEMERIIRYCYERGIGSHMVSRMIGFSHSIISAYARDFGLERCDPNKRVEWLMGFFPPEIQADIRRIRMRSDVAHASAKNREEQAPSRRLHLLVDEESDPCVNNSGTVRPEKEAA